jgi:hypothetical protein
VASQLAISQSGSTSTYFVDYTFVVFLLIIGSVVLSAAIIGNATALHEIRNSPACHINTDNNIGFSRKLQINQALSVRAIVNLSDSNIILKPSMILNSSLFTDRPADSRFSIELLDRGGRILAHYPVDLIVSTARVEEWKDIAYISEAIPFNPCTAKFAIKMDDKILASQVISPHVPMIGFIKVNNGNNAAVKSELIFPRTSNITIKWEAHDLDEDKLTYLLVYSNDGGLTWPTTIAEDIEQNSLTFNADSLPGNSIDLSRFRIIATDGANTDVRDSDPVSIPVRNLGH